ncbi:MAG TPA: Gfo/Idh/MocA family oxidoreductase [Steroidobacteraceae bacterium]|nr:Gfo/Idh/MocA family oxidoreductase [Steroidobacteraceae bacterium]
MKISAGIIGFGLAGRYFHAPLLRQAGFDISHVVSSKPDAVHELLPQADVLASADELFARPVDLVVIASPNQLHFPQARAALAAGKHVVVDKPVAVTSKEARELASVARESDRMLAVFQNRRWDSDFLTLQRSIAENRLGAINSYEARWDRFRPNIADRWREHAEPGAGVLFDLGSHLIDQALQLFGMPDWLQADVFAQRPNGATDDGFDLLLVKNNVRIRLGVSSLVVNNGFRYRVHGSKASYLKSGLDMQEAQSRAGMEPGDAAFGIEPESQWGTLFEPDGGNTLVAPERGCWVRFYEQVRAAIENGSRPPVSAEEAARVIEIIEAAFVSSREGRRIHF